MQYVYIYRLMSTSSPRIGEEEEEKEEEKEEMFYEEMTLFCQYQKT